MKKHSSKTSEHQGIKKIFYSINGWGGAVMILAAYLLVSFSILSAQSYWYQGLNIVGSFGLTVEAFSKRDQPLAVLNGLWVLIGIVAVMQVAMVHVR